MWSLCTCINSKPCYGSFVLVSRANLTSTPACVTALWIYAASSQHLVTVSYSLPSLRPPPPPARLSPFSAVLRNFGSTSGRIRDIRFFLVPCAKTRDRVLRCRDPWDTRVSQKIFEKSHRDDISYRKYPNGKKRQYPESRFIASYTYVPQIANFPPTLIPISEKKGKIKIKYM